MTENYTSKKIPEIIIYSKSRFSLITGTFWWPMIVLVFFVFFKKIVYLCKVPGSTVAPKYWRGGNTESSTAVEVKLVLNFLEIVGSGGIQKNCLQWKGISGKSCWGQDKKNHWYWTSQIPIEIGEEQIVNNMDFEEKQIDSNGGV